MFNLALNFSVVLLHGNTCGNSERQYFMSQGRHCFCSKFVEEEESCKEL